MARLSRFLAFGRLSPRPARRTTRVRRAATSRTSCVLTHHSPHITPESQVRPRARRPLFWPGRKSPALPGQGFMQQKGNLWSNTVCLGLCPCDSPICTVQACARGAGVRVVVMRSSRDECGIGRSRRGAVGDPHRSFLQWQAGKERSALVSACAPIFMSLFLTPLSPQVHGLWPALRACNK